MRTDELCEIVEALGWHLDYRSPQWTITAGRRVYVAWDDPIRCLVAAIDGEFGYRRWVA